MRIAFLSVIFALFVLANDIDLNEFESEYKQEQIFDPLSGYNRFMTKVNDSLYKGIFIPILKGYDYVMPDEGQRAIENFFTNLMYPIRLTNNLLQFKFKNAGDETLRFIANTIIGFGGISDVATTYYQIPKHDEDFGQTLGHWGVGSGFPVVLPLFGQKNLRDIVGMVGDYFVNPLTYADHWWAKDHSYISSGVKVFQGLNQLSIEPELYIKLTKDAVDLYPFIRDVYEQQRANLIKE